MPAATIPRGTRAALLNGVAYKQVPVRTHRCQARDAEERCPEWAYWWNPANYTGFCKTHAGEVTSGWTAKGWRMANYTGYRCNHETCQPRGITAMWHYRPTNYYGTANPVTYQRACDAHVPLADGSIGLPGAEEPPEARTYPFVLSAADLPLNRYEVPMDTARPTPTLAVVSLQQNVLRRVRETSVPIVLKLLDALDVDIVVESYQRAVLTPRKVITNQADMLARRQARQAYAASAKQFHQLETRWRGLQGVRPQYLDLGLIQTLVEDVRTWPEVIAAVTGDGRIVVEDGSTWTAGPGAMLIRFWPVFYDDVRGQTGLTAPMVFQVEPTGVVKWVWMSNHPHAYHDRAGSICQGAQADFTTGVGLARALGNLRDWWVGTDGRPAVSNWRERSISWWDNYRATFVTQHPEAHVIIAPHTDDGLAERVPLDTATLDDLLQRTDPRRPCGVCGERHRVTDMATCGQCTRLVCGQHYWGASLCTACIETFNCERCQGMVSQRYDERYTCGTCNQRLCVGCMGRFGRAICATCAPASVTPDDQASGVEVYVPVEGTFFQCEYPSMRGFYDRPSDACKAPAPWQHEYERGTGPHPGDAPRYLCELHHAALTVPVPEPEPEPETLYFGGQTYTRLPQLAGSCTWPHDYCGNVAIWGWHNNRRCASHAR
jgi:hypothetical protein